VPLGTAIGQIAGWRTAFWGVSGLGALAALALALVLPSDLEARRSNIVAQVGALLRPQVLTGLALGLCFTIGLFSCFSYLAPLLTTVSGASPGQIPLLLMAFGAGATVGVLSGGRLADWRLRTAIILAFAAQIAAYVALIFLSQSLSAMWALVFVLGLSGMAVVAPLRMVVLRGAADAPALAATMTSSAFNLGVAIGAALGAGLLDAGVSYALLPVAGIAFAGLALTIIHRTSL
jgi:MFS transporter, DHA1 family, inner membrane transport protein